MSKFTNMTRNEYRKLQLAVEVERLKDLVRAYTTELTLQRHRVQEVSGVAESRRQQIKALETRVQYLEGTISHQSDRIGHLAAALAGVKLKRDEYRKQLKKAVPGWTDARKSLKKVRKKAF